MPYTSLWSPVTFAGARRRIVSSRRPRHPVELAGAEIGQVQLAVVVLPEGADRPMAVEEDGRFLLVRPVGDQAADDARALVAEDIPAHEGGPIGPAVHEAADDRAVAGRVVDLGDR